ncbi:GH23447 [Drosophila grimshawi]|uniref:GH23447 n=1 Tax=Drosophila grimshawi TaxID=7222 RepID=B4K2Q4_DROGR|nr:GH23447 [Drosophila grimshawi]
MAAPIENENENECASDWHLWCRLCAKDDLQGNINVFLKNEHSAPGGERDGDAQEVAASAPIADMALATAIGKYFWVNITRGEELPEMICSECLTLVTSLVNFSERITRVQKLYCILQSTPKQDAISVQELRGRFGLIEEEQQLPEQSEPETLTEVHYVEEKPKLNELDETVLELENPLTPASKIEEKPTTESVTAEAEVEEEQVLEDEEEEEEAAAEAADEQLEYEDAGTELLLNLCDAYSNADSNEDSNSSSPKPKSKERGKAHQCNECPRAYALPQTLQRHMRQYHDKKSTPDMKLLCCEHHTDYAPYECDVCKKCFKSLSRLKHHKETHDPHKYICPECGMQLNSRPTLNRHRLVHTDQMQHKCDYCGREFKRAKALKNHLILHTGLKPYSCDFCDRTFANGSNCRTHKKKSHPEELAAQEAAGGAKTYNRNIPKLEALKALCVFIMRHLNLLPCRDLYKLVTSSGVVFS